MGISRTFQNLLLWRHMTSRAVKMAHYSRIRYGLFGPSSGTTKRHKKSGDREKACTLLE